MTSDQATVGAFIVTVLVAATAAARWLWVRITPFFGEVNKTLTEINGRPAQFDRAGEKIADPVPSLMAQVADIRQTISDQATQNQRLSAIEATQAEHGHRLDRLEDGAHIERVVGRVESAQAWKAMEAIAKQEDQ